MRGGLILRLFIMVVLGWSLIPEQAETAPLELVQAQPDESVRQVQEQLNALGYDAGAADGLMGRRTRDAIKSFQRATGLIDSGRISPDLLQQLNDSGTANGSARGQTVRQRIRPGVQGPRVALVIGNSAYINSPLRNPANDARLIADTLRSVGFEVIENVDLSQSAMKQAIITFGDRLYDAGDKAVGLFYYAGHGLQVAGKNYLVPVDAQIEREAHVEVMAVDANWVLAQMEYASSQINIMILDACRNNPYTRSFRDTTRGLARMEAPRGTMIAYSTRPGEVARDGEGANSPYTMALAQTMRLPGLELSDVFRETRVKVLAATADAQYPWEEGGLTAEFYITSPKPASLPEPIIGADPTSGQRDDVVFWQSIQNSHNSGDFEAFLSAFPNSPFATLARNRLAGSAAVDTAMVAVPPEIVPPPPSTDAARRDGDVFRDCPDCPSLVALPTGSFSMGSPESEQGRFADESPVRTVVINHRLAVARTEVTLTDFEAFLEASGYQPEEGCWDWNGAEMVRYGDKHWRDPGFVQQADHPITCVSFADAEAYIAWLSNLAGKSYRLLSEAEWEYAARAGSTTARFWGASADNACGYANVHDRTSRNENGFIWQAHDCDDGAANTAPVASYEANGFGLYDMLGNVWEWTADCWNESYDGSPSDGSVWLTGNCERRVLRGGSWLFLPRFVRSANRYWAGPGFRYVNTGFRVARELEQ